MLVALYIGDHRSDTLAVRAGWALTRLAQKGPYERVTHCEAILWTFGRGVADIASSSVRDGGVRIKTEVKLNPQHWWIVEVPTWSAAKAHDWFMEHDEDKYDIRGALATLLPGSPTKGRAFCSHSVLAAVGFAAPATFTPAQLAAICFTLGHDVTAEFFAEAGGHALQ